MRLDKYLSTEFNLKSRTYAENLVKTGKVLLNGSPATKTSLEVAQGAVVEIVSDEKYASQGAYKLEEAFRVFKPVVAGKACADIGCSNGGFTDVLLRFGAASVLAVDVAECALPANISGDGRVSFLKANARDLPKELEKVDFVCSDVSFISLKYILGSVYGLLKPGGEAVALIKPQFELNKSALDKNGIVTSEKERLKAVESVKAYSLSAGFEIKGFAPSPVRFENKNREYLLYIRRPAALQKEETDVER